MLKRVAELPKRVKSGGEPYVAKDVREFCRNRTYDVAEVTAEGKTSKSVFFAIRRYLKRNPDKCKGVGCCMRNGRTYLYRDETRS